MERTTVFISYSWDDEDHKEWVLNLANRLRNDGIDIILDRYYLHPGTNVSFFVENSIKQSDRIIIVFTPMYRNKAEKREGGVGQEYSIINNELLDDIALNKKIIPILLKGSKDSSIPSFLKQYLFLDFTISQHYEENYEELIREIYKKPKIEIPKIGNAPKLDAVKENCQLLLFRPYQKPFSWINFDIIIDGRNIGVLESNSSKIISIEKGKHTLKLSYHSVEKHLHPRDPGGTVTYSGSSDEYTIILDQSEKKYRCEYHELKKGFLGIVFNEGHKIYISEF